MTTSDLSRHNDCHNAIVTAPGCVSVGPYSLAMTAGDLLITSGQIGLCAAAGTLVRGGFEAELRQIFSNFEGLLAAAGLSFADAIKCTVYLTDAADFARLNPIYAEHFPHPFPARTTIVVADLPLGARVEIEMILRRR
ncbi:MAG: Rid family detoxifying hydrolase [Candidatus Sphingomonas phytovorans]|nr:Rid family detoxifying hydrolase [Sphingomonas sp.]WEK00225.1 MAG: Rid family detoxifying hydrolase [Sphingomonas sp.]